MSFLLDTDVCSAYLKGNPKVFARALQHSGGLSVSAVTVGELYTWAFRANAPPTRREALGEFFVFVDVLDLTRQVAEEFARTRAALLDSGQPVHSSDLFIAATALVHDLTLVTHNTRHFERIPSLRIQDWLTL